jgi:hypothetical protein
MQKNQANEYGDDGNGDERKRGRPSKMQSSRKNNGPKYTNRSQCNGDEQFIRHKPSLNCELAL